MRTLTIITVVLAMPTIVFSFYGMNVDLPLDNTWLLPAAFSIALAALVAVLLSRGRFFTVAKRAGRWGAGVRAGRAGSAERMVPRGWPHANGAAWVGLVNQTSK